MRKKLSLYCPLVIMIVVSSSCANKTESPSNLELLSAIENAFVDIATKAKPAIVGIFAGHSDRELNRAGSGFFYREDGHILTNDHIVRGADYYRVRLLDGTELDAKLVGADIITDIAVLKVNREEVFPTLPLANSEKVKVGQFAVAIGNPFQLEYSVTTGVVSGKGRSVPLGLQFIRHQNFIQTDAWIHTGSSGGPLLNIYGEVIGINALIRKVENTPAPVRAGAGFAIPSNMVNSIGEQLIAHGKIIRGYLGIRMREVQDGIRVTFVRSDTPAYRAGMRRNDVIVEYNGERIKKSVDLMMLIAESQVGKKAVIKVLRSGKDRTLNVIIDEIPPELAGIPYEDDSVSWKTLGLAVRKLEKHDFERYTYLTEEDSGVVVERVKIDAPGYNAKIPRGSLILKVNGKEIPDVAALEAILQLEQEAEELEVEIKSSFGVEQVTVNLPKE